MINKSSKHKKVTRLQRVKTLARIPSSLKNGLKKGIGARLIAFPEQKRRLEKELSKCEVLGDTSDGKIVYLTNKSQSPPRSSEIVGGYRVANFSKINRNLKSKLKPLYIQSLFTLDDSIEEKLKTTVELGRSFIQPKYWGSRNLDHLWMGIGAYLYKHPDIQYMIGPVSMPNHYPTEAKSLICHYYQTYFGCKDANGTIVSLAKGTTPYKNILSNPFHGKDSANDMKLLRKKLESSASATPIPTLYKHYTEILYRRINDGRDKQNEKKESSPLY